MTAQQRTARIPVESFHSDLAEQTRRAWGEKVSNPCVRGQHEKCHGRRVLVDYSFAPCTCRCHREELDA